MSTFITSPEWRSLDGYLSSAVLLNKEGAIVYANAAWRRFMQSNGGDEGRCGVGVNYLDVCRRAAEDDPDAAAQLVDGIRGVLEGAKDWFEVNYPCHSPFEQRWFRMRVEPYADEWGARVLVLHSPVIEAEAQTGSRGEAIRLLEALDAWQASLRRKDWTPGPIERERLQQLQSELAAALQAVRNRLSG